MCNYNISGIQQVGIGVEDLELAWAWYAKYFGMDLPIFKDEADATFMAKYTGNKIESRSAVLAMNLKGGGGFEVWQYTSRTPVKPKFDLNEGDLGITHVHLRTPDINTAHNYFKEVERIELLEISKNQLGIYFFCLKDPFGNWFKIIEDDYVFMKTNHLIGGVVGVTIGVSDSDKSMSVYQKGLKYDSILSRAKTKSGLEKVWLGPTKIEPSAFGDWLGTTKIELVYNSENKNPHTFKDRYWGDLGFIHVCFDVQKMKNLRLKCSELNHPFTVDSENGFNMGEAAGQFAYIEDVDKTLIELVETHKVPIIKKLGWYINLKNKKTQKPLPKIIYKVLAMKRVKSS